MQLQKIINSQIKLGFQIQSNLNHQSDFKDQKWLQISELYFRDKKQVLRYRATSEMNENSGSNERNFRKN